MIITVANRGRFPTSLTASHRILPRSRRLPTPSPTTITTITTTTTTTFTTTTTTTTTHTPIDRDRRCRLLFSAPYRPAAYRCLVCRPVVVIPRRYRTATTTLAITYYYYCNIIITVTAFRVTSRWNAAASCSHPPPVVNILLKPLCLLVYVVARFRGALKVLNYYFCCCCFFFFHVLSFFVHFRVFFLVVFQLDDAALQLYKDGDLGSYLDMEASISEQQEDFEGFQNE